MHLLQVRLLQCGVLILVIFVVAQPIIVTIYKYSSGNLSHSSSNSMHATHELKRPRLNSTTIASMMIGATIPDSVEVFYSSTRKDRSGALILDMLMAHAFAWTLGRQYGGVCGSLYPSAVDHRRMINVLGLDEELPYPLKPRPCEHLNGTATNMVLNRDVYMKWKDTDIFTPEWTKYIRQRQQNQKPKKALRSSKTKVQIEKQQQQQPRVIVHIRRGDVTPCISEHFRYVPNSHYLDLITQYAIRTDNNTNTTSRYNVTVYSESKSFESWQDFNRSVQAPCTLALDGDMANVWRDMLGYNDHIDASIRRILILSMSSFSLVPAILANPATTTVVYTPFWHKPLPHWHVVGTSETKKAEFETLRLRLGYCAPP